jgi:HK97 family phage prohead protease
MPSNTKVTKAFSTELKAKDKKTGIIEAVVSVFGNLDRGREIVAPGAFKESLARKLPKGVWHHRGHIPVAKTLEAKETDEGLFIKGQFNMDTQRGREAFSDIDFGIIDEFSIGYTVRKETWDREERITTLLQVDLWEWSPVLVGMNQSTRLVGTKMFDELLDLSSGSFEELTEATVKILNSVEARIEDYSQMRDSRGFKLSDKQVDNITIIKEKLEGLLKSNAEEPLSTDSIKTQLLRTQLALTGTEIMQ